MKRKHLKPYYPIAGLFLATVVFLIACSDYLPRDNKWDPLGEVGLVDGTAPTVVNISPSDGSSGQPRVLTVEIEFSEMMNRESVQQTFTMTDNEIIQSRFRWSDHDSKVTYVPTNYLGFSKLYTVDLGASAADAQYNNMETDFTANFFTVGPEGVLSTSFDYDGWITHDGGDEDEVHDVVIDSDGKILVAGSIFNGTNKLMAVWRLNYWDGSLDYSFGVDGVVTHDGLRTGGGDDEALAIAIDSSGRILVAGYSRSTAHDDDMALWCLEGEHGYLDTSFTNGGFVTDNDAAGGDGADRGQSIVLDDDGNIFIGGYSLSLAYNRIAVWKYNSSGALVSDFGTSGIALTDSAVAGAVDAGGDAAGSITKDSTGRVLVSGNSNFNGPPDVNEIFVCRFTSGGVRDTTFSNGDGSDGIFYFDANRTAGYDDFEGGMVLDADGSIFVTGCSFSGGADKQIVVFKLDENGSLDNTFGDGSDGSQLYNGIAGGSDEDEGVDIVLDEEGKLLVAGFSDNASGNSDMCLMKLNSDGSLDSSFDNYFIHHNAAGGGGDDKAAALTVTDYGNILVVGSSSNGTDSDLVLWMIE